MHFIICVHNFIYLHTFEFVVVLKDVKFASDSLSLIRICCKRSRHNCLKPELLNLIFKKMFDKNTIDNIDKYQECFDFIRRAE